MGGGGNVMNPDLDMNVFHDRGCSSIFRFSVFDFSIASPPDSGHINRIDQLTHHSAE